ncbi:rRNA-processing protein utp23 [Anaeramoeba flamelloides]|uniref:rRNA-processing protein utp23 n=1 Tax=Anaeramoeba flamelloides TaxID=1746091 RepID=A0AAV7YNQ3_9EUKA|nr:rRNA-processing protein utp23 [Anaeramoeba flamelloides]
MKIGRKKKFKRIIRYFQFVYGFRSPFLILMDGNFIFAALDSDVSLPGDLEKILQGKVMLHTSKCILKELKDLGEEFSGSHLYGKKCAKESCRHDTQYTVSRNCILEIIKNRGDRNIIVATQDVELREKLQDIPGVPSIFIRKDKLYLSEISQASKDYANNREQEGSGITNWEKSLLKKKGLWEEKNNDKNKKPLHRKKKAKAPNPLSLKKKKKQGQTQNRKKFSREDKQTTNKKKSIRQTQPNKKEENKKVQEELSRKRKWKTKEKDTKNEKQKNKQSEKKNKNEKNGKNQEIDKPKKAKSKKKKNENENENKNKTPKKEKQKNKQSENKKKNEPKMKKKEKETKKPKKEKQKKKKKKKNKK